MENSLIVLIVLLCLILAVIAFGLFAYFVLLPKLLIKKIRSGEANVKYPEDFDTIKSKVITENDCIYPSEYPSNSYDIYRSISGESKGTIIWVHGGFFIAGDKEGVSNLAVCLAAYGYTFIAINYAVAPEYKYPTQLKQLNDIINHIKTSRKDINSGKIIIAGDSAGGHIALQYTSLVNNTQMQQEIGISPYIDSDSISAMVLVSAPIDLGRLYGYNKKMDKLLPIFGRALYGKGKWMNSKRFNYTKSFNYLTNTFPPTFLTDGNNMSFELQNKKLGEKLRELNVPVSDLYFDKTEYGDVYHEYIFCLDNDTALLGLNKLKDFLDSVN